MKNSDLSSGVQGNLRKLPLLDICKCEKTYLKGLDTKKIKFDKPSMWREGPGSCGQ